MVIFTVLYNLLIYETRELQDELSYLYKQMSPLCADVTPNATF